jgi:hypothetical protein
MSEPSINVDPKVIDRIDEEIISILLKGMLMNPGVILDMVVSDSTDVDDAAFEKVLGSMPPDTIKRLAYLVAMGEKLRGMEK